jgi:hypothetical protein
MVETMDMIHSKCSEHAIERWAIIANLNSFSANFAVALKLREDVLPTAESIETLDFRLISSNAEDSQLIKKELQSLSTQS